MQNVKLSLSDRAKWIDSLPDRGGMVFLYANGSKTPIGQMPAISVRRLVMTYAQAWQQSGVAAILYRLG